MQAVLDIKPSGCNKRLMAKPSRQRTCNCHWHIRTRYAGFRQHVSHTARVLILLLTLGMNSALAMDPASSTRTTTTQPGAPNILLIVLDDVAYTDLGHFGGEIGTPNLDRLAAEGVVMTEFHVSPNCSPTRAMLLSGVDSHLAGLGTMAEEPAPNQQGVPGYEGYLNFRVAALPEVLQDAGYRTYMTGKWHLGLTEETGPVARGFDRAFAMLNGGAGAFANMLPLVGPGKAAYRADSKALAQLPEDFYSTRFYTRRMIDYLKADAHSDRPFFAYLAYTAPHWPLQAPKASIARYRGRFDDGYDAYAARRLQRLRELGLVVDSVSVFPRLPGEPAWGDLTDEQRQFQARLMEIYAAMVSDVDHYLGELLDYLREAGQLDETLIFVLSDNGPEGHVIDQGYPVISEWVQACCDNRMDNMGAADSYLWYGPNWAQAGNTPRRMFKGFTAQGGLTAPALVWYPKAIPTGRVDEIISVMDVMPTLLDAAGTNHPGTRFRGRDTLPMQGRSLLPLLTGQVDRVGSSDYWIGWELFGKRAIRQGDWKLVYLPAHESRIVPDGVQTDTWQLYNLRDDPSELRDLSEQHPERLSALLELWERYVRDNQVILPDTVSLY